MIAAYIVASLAVILAFIGGQVEKKHTYCLSLAFFILTLFLSLGYYWGNDVATYEEWYEGIIKSDVRWWEFLRYSTFSQKEIGYICINLLFRPIGFWWMRAFYFVIENYIIYSFIVKYVHHRWHWFAVYIYVFNPNFWVLSSSMMRQWAAVCVIVWGVGFLIQRKYLSFAGAVLLATAFHLTAIICLLFLPLAVFQNNAKKSRIYLLLLLLLGYYIVAPFFINYVAFYLSAVEIYMGYTDTAGTIGISTILRLLFFLALLWFSVVTKQQNNLLNWVVAMSALMLPLIPFGALSSRLGYYFTIFTIGIYPLFIKNLKIRKGKRIFLLSFVCVFNLYSFFSFFYNPTWINSYGTYQTLIGKL